MKKRKDGRYEKKIRYNGRRYSVYSNTIKGLNEKEDALRRQLAAAEHKDSAVTLDDYYEKWSTSRKNTVAGATVRQQYFLYRTMADVTVRNGVKFGTLRLNEIERRDILELQKGLYSIRRSGGRFGYSTMTVNNMIAIVSHMMSDAIMERLISWNPAKGVKPLKKTGPMARDTIHRALTVDETKAFFAAARGEWYEPLFEFLLFTGCRIGEASAIRYSNINNKSLTIKNTVSRDEHGIYYVSDTAKTAAGVRTIPMTEDMRMAIRAQRSLNKETFGREEEGYVFRSKSGGIVRESVVNRNITAICLKAGIDRFTAHAFRDTFATRALESGMKPKTLQEILGHSDIGMTMNLYAHVMETTKVKEMRMIKISIT